MTIAIIFVATVAIAVTVGLWIGHDPEGAKTIWADVRKLFKKEAK